MSSIVYIDTQECIGCENCVELCPDIFELDRIHNTAFVIDEEGGSEECIEAAIEDCPVECIYWEDEE